MKDRIRSIRKEFKLNQSDFGARIGVTQSAVAGYESGIRVPIDAIIHSICRVFGVNEEWLRTGSGEQFVERTRNEVIAEFIGRVETEDEDSYKMRFINMLANLSEDQWKLLESIGNMLLDQQKKD